MGKKMRTRIYATLALLLALPGVAAAQCALCRELAAQAGADKAINLAILVLLIPTLVLFVGLIVVPLRRRDREMEVPPSGRGSHVSAVDAGPANGAPEGIPAETVLRVSWLHEPRRPSVKR